MTALGGVHVGKKGSILGNVACRKLAMEPGACLVGHVRVDPEFAPEPAPLEELE